MSHDLEDLLEMIRFLEERIVVLERHIIVIGKNVNPEDTWYWEHG